MTQSRPPRRAHARLVPAARCAGAAPRAGQDGGRERVALGRGGRGARGGERAAATAAAAPRAPCPARPRPAPPPAAPRRALRRGDKTRCRRRRRRLPQQRGPRQGGLLPGAGGAPHRHAEGDQEGLLPGASGPGGSESSQGCPFGGARNKPIPAFGAAGDKGRRQWESSAHGLGDRIQKHGLPVLSSLVSFQKDLGLLRRSGSAPVIPCFGLIKENEGNAS
ncbi:hypothetical protein Nmel_014359 [Mimus melanotis]